MGQWRHLSLFTLLKWGADHTCNPSCCFLYFQRLVEAAEEAHLKHEFDADLQVTDYHLSSVVSCVCCQRRNARYTRNTEIRGWERKAFQEGLQWWKKCTCFLIRWDRNPQPFSTTILTVADHTCSHACNQILMNSSPILGELFSQVSVIIRTLNGKLIRQIAGYRRISGCILSHWKQCCDGSNVELTVNYI